MKVNKVDVYDGKKVTYKKEKRSDTTVKLTANIKTNGKMIEVAFGFTKQRYTAEEIIDTTEDQDLYNALPTAVTPSRTR